MTTRDYSREQAEAATEDGSFLGSIADQITATKMIGGDVPDYVTTTLDHSAQIERLLASYFGMVDRATSQELLHVLMQAQTALAQSRQTIAETQNVLAHEKERKDKAQHAVDVLFSRWAERGGALGAIEDMAEGPQGSDTLRNIARVAHDYLNQE